MSQRRSGSSFLLLAALVFSACSQPYAVSVNSQAVYDPKRRLLGAGAVEADLQGCINIALRQQGIQNPTQLTVLSCANSEIRNLENISTLTQLRFLDLANNAITNITPLEGMTALSGLNLTNNAIEDIGPLLNIPGLASVSLVGNDNIPCSQLQTLQQRLGDNLARPDNCR